MNEIDIRTVVVPAYAWTREEHLIEARCNGMTSGLCRTIEEASQRIRALVSGEAVLTQAPNFQASEKEMAIALAFAKDRGIRDGGLCLSALERAAKAGIHTVEWAIASRYLVAGWVPCR